jgi:hypothetical protein
MIALTSSGPSEERRPRSAWALGIVVAFALVVVPVIGANARQEATHHSDSHYHGHHERRNEQRKPDRTMVVGMPSDHGEQQDRDKQHDVAPVAFLGEISGPTLKLPTLLLRHEEGVDVLSDHSLERGSTGYLGFRKLLQQIQLRCDDGSQVRNTRIPFARHAAEQEATG